MTKMGCVKRTQQVPNIYLYLKPKIKEVNTSETLKLKPKYKIDIVCFSR